MLVEIISKEDLNTKLSKIYKRYEGYKITFVETKENIKVFLRE